MSGLARLRRALCLALILFVGLGLELEAAEGRSASAPSGGRRALKAAIASRAAAAIQGSTLPAEARSYFSRLVRHAPADYIPPGVYRGELLGGVFCAKVVCQVFWQAFGGEDDPETARGVIGDAWELSSNVRLHGGEVFPAPPGAAPRELGLMPGDILGLHYAESVFNDLPKPVDYTHVALVLAVLPEEGPLVIHAWMPPARHLLPGTPSPWPVRIELLSDFLDAFPGLFEPKEIIRPKDLARFHPAEPGSPGPR